MTVQQRGSKEFDNLVYPRRKMEKELIFPWRAFHNGNPVCNFSGVFYTEKEALHADATHTCSTEYAPLAGVSIAERYWLELDLVVDQIRNLDGFSPNDPEKAKLQGRASGLAFAVMISCGPYYADERAVSIEANRRWKMRNGQMDWEPTPGFKYNPPIPGASAVRTVSNQQVEGSAMRTARKQTANQPLSERAKKIAPEQIEAIKLGYNSGMFKVPDLARVYDTTPDVIEYVVKS